MESRTELQICEELHPTTSGNLMKITIIECETGEKYEISNMPIQLIEHVNSVTGSSHTVITIDHPAIKFHTEEVLIGNR
jgi:hypothetical protein